MRVPARLRTVRAATENRAQSRNVIQKIEKENESDKPPLYQIYEVLNFDDAEAHHGLNRNDLRGNASIPAWIWPVVRLVPNEGFDKHHDSPDRLKQLLKSRYFHEDEAPWHFPTVVTKRYPSLNGVEYSEVPTARPDSSTSAVWLAAPLLTFFLLLLLGILIRKIIRCLLAPQHNTCLLIEHLEEQQRSNSLDLPVTSHERNEDDLSVTLSVESQYSDQSDNETDLPPPYSECGTNRTETNNLAFSEELPPSYSTCLETFNSIDDILKVHKGLNVEEPQAPPETAAHLNNIDDTDRSNIEQNSSRTLSTVVDTTNLDNRLVGSQGGSENVE
ncbi:unnamed protein product [Arctia plantaginis]|uniref:Uncharacterized protein n=1 Tax=Arctia plantaginis TaxID=874455 RepID=A0A8S0Z2A0_ARCPL|nr:unnamed protein product [Arctia plantaginis]